MMAKDYVIGWHPAVPDEHGLSEDSLRGTPEVIDTAPHDRFGNDLERAPLSYHEAVALHNAGRGSEIDLEQFGTPHGSESVFIGVMGASKQPVAVTESTPQVDESQLSESQRTILNMIPDTKQRNIAARKMLDEVRSQRSTFGSVGGTVNSGNPFPDPSVNKVALESTPSQSESQFTVAPNLQDKPDAD